MVPKPDPGVAVGGKFWVGDGCLSVGRWVPSQEIAMGQSPPLALPARSREDDKNWPEPDRVGRQELEVVMGNEHISFTVCMACLPAVVLFLFGNWRGVPGNTKYTRSTCYCSCKQLF